LSINSLYCSKFKILALTFSAVDAKKCYVTGRGIQANGIRVGDAADFKVHTLGAGEGDLKVVVSGPGHKDEPVTVKKVSKLSRSNFAYKYALLF